MTITVDAVLKEFNFDAAKMKKLTGKSDYKEDDTIDLNHIASFGNKNLSVWAAKKEGSKLTELLPENTRAKVVQAAGIKEENTEKTENKNSNDGVIPMDTSIFDERLRRQHG